MTHWIVLEKVEYYTKKWQFYDQICKCPLRKSFQFTNDYLPRSIFSKIIEKTSGLGSD